MGLNRLNLVNDGTISATGTANSLVIQTSSFINKSLLEAVGPAGLILTTAVDDSGGGTLLSNGGTVQLSGGSIAGGTIKSSNGGSIVVNTGLLDGSLHTVTNLGIIEVNTGSTLTVLGTITNTGTIGLNSTYYNSDLVVDSPTVTLTGGGTMSLSDYNTANRIYGAFGTGRARQRQQPDQRRRPDWCQPVDLDQRSAGIIDAIGDVNQLIINTGPHSPMRAYRSDRAAGMALVSDHQQYQRRHPAGGQQHIYLNGGTIIGGTVKTNGSGIFVANGQTTLDGSTQTVTFSGTYADLARTTR